MRGTAKYTRELLSSRGMLILWNRQFERVTGEVAVGSTGFTSAGGEGGEGTAAGMFSTSASGAGTGAAVGEGGAGSIEAGETGVARTMGGGGGGGGGGTGTGRR